MTNPETSSDLVPVGYFWRWASDDKWQMLGKLSEAALEDFVRDQEKIAPVVIAPLYDATTIERLTAALRRQADNMAFVINHATLYDWADKFARELEEDRAALAASPASPVQSQVTEEWIEWHGGDCPLPDPVVEYRRRDGGTGDGNASSLIGWVHFDRGSDIVAYRLASPAPTVREV